MHVQALFRFLAMSVVTDGLREYEIPEGRPSVMAITLLRSVGWLGRAGMPWRPGRASGMALPSPDSQIPGEFTVRFALIPLCEGETQDFWRDVEAWRTPPVGWLDSGWARFKTPAITAVHTYKRFTQLPAFTLINTWSFIFNCHMTSWAHTEAICSTA